MTFLCIEYGKKLDEKNFYEKVKNKCEDCSNKKLKCQVCGTFFTKNYLTNHIEREHQSSESKPNVLEKSSSINNNDFIQNEIAASNHKP